VREGKRENGRTEIGFKHKLLTLLLIRTTFATFATLHCSLKLEADGTIEQLKILKVEREEMKKGLAREREMRIEAERETKSSKELREETPTPTTSTAKENYDLLQANAQLVEKCKSLTTKVEEAERVLFENTSLKQTVKALSATGIVSARKNSTPMSMEGRKMFERVRRTPGVSTPQRVSTATPMATPMSMQTLSTPAPTALSTPATVVSSDRYMEQIRHLQACLDKRGEEAVGLERDRADAVARAAEAKQGMDRAARGEKEAKEENRAAKAKVRKGRLN
jgi:hypothetical protein